MNISPPVICIVCVMCSLKHHNPDLLSRLRCLRPAWRSLGSLLLSFESALSSYLPAYHRSCVNSSSTPHSTYFNDHLSHVPFVSSLILKTNVKTTQSQISARLQLTHKSTRHARQISTKVTWTHMSKQRTRQIRQQESQTRILQHKSQIKHQIKRYWLPLRLYKTSVCSILTS